MKNNRPFIRQANDKWNLRSWVADMLPEDYEGMTYCEPFGGVASILLHKKPSKQEIYNDRDEGLVNLFRALRDEPKELSKRLRTQKHTSQAFESALKRKCSEDYMECAVREFILFKMGSTTDRSVFRKPRRDEDWKTHLAPIQALAPRLRNVFFTSKNAFDLIPSINLKDTLLFVDPPYLHEARANKNLYESGMEVEDHINLFRILESFSGKVMVCGCASPLYKRLYKNWNIAKKKVNTASSEKAEIVWRNF
jgi:DNA adenine methylase